MEQSPSQEATCTSVRKETACTLCNMKVHYGVQKSLPLVPLLSHINPVHASQTIPLRSILIIFSHLCLSLPTGSFLQVSPPKSCTNFSPTPYVTCTTHLILLDLINHSTFGEEYKSCSPSLFHFSSHLLLPLRHKYPPHHWYITLFWSTLSLCFSLNIRE
jgi:hypothetical protein